MGNSRNKQFVNLKSQPVPSSVTKPRDVLLPPAPDVNHSFVRCLDVVDAPRCRRPLPATPQSLSSHLGYGSNCYGISVLVLKSPLFYFIMAPKGSSSGAGSSDASKRSHKVLPSSDKVCMRRTKHSIYRIRNYL